MLYQLKEAVIISPGERYVVVPGRLGERFEGWAGQLAELGVKVRCHWAVVTRCGYTL